MNDFFSCSLKGKTWRDDIYALMLATLAILVPIELAAALAMNKPGALPLSLIVIGILALACAGTLVACIFSVKLARVLLPSLSVRGKPFSFTGRIRPFLRICLPGTLLTAITLGGYFPRYLAKASRYLVKHAAYGDIPAEIAGSSKTLYRDFLDGLVFPLAAWICTIGVLIGRIAPLAAPGGKYPLLAWTLFPLAATVLAVPIPFLCLYLKWLLGIRAGDTRIRLAAPFHSLCLFLLGQLALTIVTFGLWWPIALIKSARYIAPRVILSVNRRETARLFFRAKEKQGFLLLWGQTLLCVITLGLYAPWALAKAVGWFAENTALADISDVEHQ